MNSCKTDYTNPAQQRVRGWLLCLLLLCIQTLAFAAPIITVDDKTRHLDISTHVDLLNNPLNASLEELESKGQFNRFLPSTKTRFQEYTKAAEYLIIRFALHNTSDITQTLWLHSTNDGIEQLDVFSQNSNGKFLRLPAAPIENASITPFIKELIIPAHTHGMYYLSMSLKENSSPTLEIDTPKTFIHNYLAKSNTFAMAAAVLAMLGIINLLLALYRSNLIFLYHSCLIFSTLCTSIIILNIPLTWFDDFNAWKINATLALFFIATNSSILCLMQYIQNQRNDEQQRIYHPLYRILKNTLYINIILNIAIIFFINNYISLILLPLIIIAGILPATLLYSYFKHNDHIALAIAIVSLSTSSICFLPFAASGSFIFSINLFAQPLTWLLFILHSFIITLLFYLNDHKHTIADIHFQHIASKKTIERAAQSDLLKKISGEIQMPLSDISGASDLLLSGSALSMEQEVHCTIIRNSTMQLVHKIADIDYDIKVEEDTSPIRTSPFELIPRLERWIKKILPNAQQKNIEVIVDINNDVPFTVKGDEYRLRQILTHLLSGAILRTEQGQIIFKAWKSEADDKIVFHIEDNGTIPSVELTFPHTHSKTNAPLESHEDKANHVLHTLGSSLNIDSSPTANHMEFRLSLPAIESANTQNIFDTHLKNKRVLIVDDNKTSLDILKRQLTRWGIKCTKAEDGQKAISFYRNNINLLTPFEVIILDYDMPQINGLELAQKITQENPDQKPSIIMLVGTNQSPSERLARSAGIDFIIDKPVPQELLRTILSNIFKKNSRIHETQQPHQKIRTLVVDDDDTIRFVISKMLDSFGMAHTLVNSGQKAYDACLRENFDIILMDCQMPDMDGFETAIAIHKHQYDQGQALTPVIALTAYTLSEYKQKSQKAGMTSYLEKPIDKNELLAALQKHQP